MKNAADEYSSCYLTIYYIIYRTFTDTAQVNNWTASPKQLFYFVAIFIFFIFLLLFYYFLFLGKILWEAILFRLEVNSKGRLYSVHPNVD